MQSALLYSQNWGYSAVPQCNTGEHCQKHQGFDKYLISINFWSLLILKHFFLANCISLLPIGYGPYIGFCPISHSLRRLESCGCSKHISHWLKTWSLLPGICLLSDTYCFIHTFFRTLFRNILQAGITWEPWKTTDTWFCLYHLINPKRCYKIWKSHKVLPCSAKLEFGRKYDSQHLLTWDAGKKNENNKTNKKIIEDTKCQKVSYDLRNKIPRKFPRFFKEKFWQLI